jgi:hypothetical protein
MIHPVFRLAAAQPMLLADHVGAYAGLVSEELLLMGMALKRRWMWQLFGAVCWGISVVLGGVAVLVWASSSALPLGATWWLVLTPLLPGVVGAWAWWVACKPLRLASFARLREQLLQDTALLGRYSE